MASGTAVRVFTGGPVPPQAQCVVRREDCNESESYVSIEVPKASLSMGQNIRKQGENARTGSLVVHRGDVLSPAKYAGMLTFSDQAELDVFRKVRIGIINTGDELIDFGKPIEPWQIRDSNGPFLESMLQRYDWIESTRTKVRDRPENTQKVIQEHLERCDVILLTGGVSMGDTDFVPDAILSCGCKTIFHRLPIRPGKPILGAVGPKGQLVLGLPGNPLSVAVTFRRFAMPLIQYVAGMNGYNPPMRIEVESPDDKVLELTWFRLMKIAPSGRAEIIPSQGSGDIASLVHSDGFVEIPPMALSAGFRMVYPW
jgi:molybdopterin molybdotransferase